MSHHPPRTLGFRSSWPCLPPPPNLGSCCPLRVLLPPIPPLYPNWGGGIEFGGATEHPQHLPPPQPPSEHPTGLPPPSPPPKGGAGPPSNPPLSPPPQFFSLQSQQFHPQPLGLLLLHRQQSRQSRCLQPPRPPPERIQPLAPPRPLQSDRGDPPGQQQRPQQLQPRTAGTPTPPRPPPSRASPSAAL